MTTVTAHETCDLNALKRQCAAAATALRLRAAATHPLPPLLCLAGSSGGAVDTSRYVAELQALKGVLLAAKAEQEALEKRVGEVRWGAVRRLQLNWGCG